MPPRVRAVQSPAHEECGCLTTHIARRELWPLRHYSMYATAFRYPSPGGRVRDAPSAEQMLKDVAQAKDAATRIKDELLRSRQREPRRR